MDVAFEWRIEVDEERMIGWLQTDVAVGNLTIRGCVQREAKKMGWTEEPFSDTVSAVITLGDDKPYPDKKWREYQPGDAITGTLHLHTSRRCHDTEDEAKQHAEYQIRQILAAFPQ